MWPTNKLLSEYDKLRWEMNRFNNISPEHPHSLDACFYFTKNKEFQSLKFASRMALLLDQVFESHYQNKEPEERNRKQDAEAIRLFRDGMIDENGKPIRIQNPKRNYDGIYIHI